LAIGLDSSRDEECLCGEHPGVAIDSRFHRDALLNCFSATVCRRTLDLLEVVAGHDVDTLFTEGSLYLSAELHLHPREDAVGALKDRDVDANAVEDLPPLQCDVPAADDGDALWEVAFVENGLAGVVLDVVEAVNGWRPR